MIPPITEVRGGGSAPLVGTNAARKESQPSSCMPDGAEKAARYEINSDEKGQGCCCGHETIFQVLPKRPMPEIRLFFFTKSTVPHIAYLLIGFPQSTEVRDSSIFFFLEKPPENCAISAAEMKLLYSHLLTPLFASAIPGVQAGFSEYCIVGSLDGTYIDASCGDGTGHYVSTSLDLNHCFWNDDGVLKAGKE